MGELGKLIQEYIDRQEYPPSDAAIGRRLGVTRSTVGNWKRGDAMPKPDNLRDLATLMGVSYTRVLDAALADSGYLPKERGGSGNAAPNTQGPDGPAPSEVPPSIPDTQAPQNVHPLIRERRMPDPETMAARRGVLETEDPDFTM